ncbi:hypothetical protein BT96DRAFT_843500, partial [Gymnopus androsaceus JB14]
WESVPDTNNEQCIIWLCEPLRLSTPKRFTTTLEYQCIQNDLLSQMIDAFVHYAYIQSQKDLLFADIQGDRGRLSNGDIGTVLFDVMTHSSDGQTGVGDHGLDALADYDEVHKCNQICARLIEAVQEGDYEEE